MSNEHIQYMHYARQYHTNTFIGLFSTLDKAVEACQRHCDRYADEATKPLEWQPMGNMVKATDEYGIEYHIEALAVDLAVQDAINDTSRTGTHEMSQDHVIGLVRSEREAQDAKWGEQNHDDYKWLAIMSEELGEVSQAILHTEFGGRAAGTTEAELIQLAAVAVSWLECIQRRKAQPAATIEDKKKAIMTDRNWRGLPGQVLRFLKVHQDFGFDMSDYEAARMAASGWDTVAYVWLRDHPDRYAEAVLLACDIDMSESK